MTTWKVNVGGQDRTVAMESPVFGRKVIFVDGQELKKVGTFFSMWSSYKFDLDGIPAVIKFRAVKNMKGMSLYVNGKRVNSEPGGEMSAESVQRWMLMIPLIAAVVFFIARMLR